jgi:hypothetical protein
MKSFRHVGFSGTQGWTLACFLNIPYARCVATRWCLQERPFTAPYTTIGQYGQSQSGIGAKRAPERAEIILCSCRSSWQYICLRLPGMNSSTMRNPAKALSSTSLPPPKLGTLYSLYNLHSLVPIPHSSKFKTCVLSFYG